MQHNRKFFPSHEKSGLPCRAVRGFRAAPQRTDFRPQSGSHPLGSELKRSFSTVKDRAGPSPSWMKLHHTLQPHVSFLRQVHLNPTSSQSIGNASQALDSSPSSLRALLLSLSTLRQSRPSKQQLTAIKSPLQHDNQMSPELCANVHQAHALATTALPITMGARLGPRGSTAQCHWSVCGSFGRSALGRDTTTSPGRGGG